MKRVLVIENYQDRGEDIERLVLEMDHAASRVRPYALEALPAAAGFDAVILSGGPMSVRDARSPAYAYLSSVIDYTVDLIQEGVPCLGICLGHQILATVLGGKVGRMRSLDAGVRQIRPTRSDLFPEVVGFDSFVFHRDHVVDLPPNCVVTFASDGCAVEGFRHLELPIEAVQFHPEVPQWRAIEVLDRWGSNGGGKAIGDTSSFDSGGAHFVLSTLVTKLLTIGGSQ